MNCLDTLAPNDEELLRFVIAHEPLTSDAQAHLLQCSTCQQRLYDYKKIHGSLLTRLYREHCPSATQLNMYCAGHILPADETFHIAQHLTECLHCTLEVAAIRRTLSAFDPFATADTLGIQHALPVLVRRIIAQLLPIQPEPATRNGYTARWLDRGISWPRLYRTSTLDISLHISRASNGDTLLLGILTSTEPNTSVDAFEDAPAKLYPANENMQQVVSYCGDQAPKPTLATKVDDIGNIFFTGVPDGNYTLIVCLPDAEIALEGLIIEKPF
jgi:hypothetical protein